MRSETWKTICKNVKKLGDLDFDEGERLVVKDAIELMKASIVYQLYEVGYEDDNGAYMVGLYTDVIEVLSKKNPDDEVEINWHPMGGFIVSEDIEEA